MSENKKELSLIQRTAIISAREKANEAQNFLRQVLNEILKEHSIPLEEMAKWEFSENFRFIERIKREPEMVIPKGK